MGDVYLTAEPSKGINEFSSEQMADLESLGFVPTEWWGDAQSPREARLTCFEAKRAMPIPQAFAGSLRAILLPHGINIKLEAHDARK